MALALLIWATTHLLEPASKHLHFLISQTQYLLTCRTLS